MPHAKPTDPDIRANDPPLTLIGLVDMAQSLGLGQGLSIDQLNQADTLAALLCV